MMDEQQAFEAWKKRRAYLVEGEWNAWAAAKAESASEIERLRAALADCVEALAHLQDQLAIRVNPPTLENARAALEPQA